MVKKLAKYMKGMIPFCLLSISGMIIEAMCELSLPSIANNIYNSVSQGNADTKGYVLKMGAIMLGLAVLGLAGGLVTMKTSSIVSQRFSYRLREAMYEKISAFSFKNIDQFSTSSLTTRLTNDVTTIQNLVMMCLRILVRAPALLVVSAVFAVSINAKLSAILLFCLPIIAIIAGVLLKFGLPMFQKMQKKIDNVNRVVQENLIGIRVVKAFVREDKEKEKFHTASDDLAKQGAKAAGLMITVMPLMMLMMNFVIVYLYYKGANDAANGLMDVGQISVFASYVIQVLMNIMMVSMMLIGLARGKACGDRIVEVLDAQVDIKNPENPFVPTNPKGNIQFKNVDFSYNTDNKDDKILDNICFEAKGGEIIGIIGSTGCGKSTLVNLIPRLYDVTKGEILIDGVNIKDYSLEALRDLIGVVLQKNV